METMHANKNPNNTKARIDALEKEIRNYQAAIDDASEAMDSATGELIDVLESATEETEG